ncbi:6,7-dimethyl-8-ribityllumazine synthase [bacterium]|nr:6,7-dimethyl-8-ribityllumazine synthase [bacterium]
MPNILQGEFKAQGLRFAIIVSRFNEFITRQLVSGAVDALSRHGANEEDIFVVKVPGAFEIPYAAAKMARQKKHDAIICLGAVIRGDTPHFGYISSEVTKGIAKIALESEMPVIYGIITAETIEQAIERAGTKAGNKGWDAAMAAMEMLDLYNKLGGKV